MSSAVATFSDVSLFDGRFLAPGAGRRLLGGAMTGLGTVAAACVLAAAAMASAAWIIGTALSTNPSFHAKAAIGLATIGVPNQRLTLAGAANFSDSLHLADRDHRLHWARETELARAAIPAPAPIEVVPLPEKRPAEVATTVPPPHPSAPARELKPKLADAPDLTHVTELTPAAAPPVQPAPVPLKPVADDVPLPPQRPPAAPHLDAKDESAPTPASPAAPHVAMVAPVPPPPAPGKSPSLLDDRTAVYDISAHTVYLPSGKKLEAHSGLGYRRDDPRYVEQKNRGPTPPNVYDLALREGRFHGVRAIRLNPVDENKMFGRDGMLAHTYMLGSTGQSFGCVSFKNYPAFLQAYLNGEVERLAVVPHLDSPPARTARAANAPRFALNDE